VELKVKRYIIDLGDSNTNVRARAAEALCNIGDAASEAIPHLVKLIGNSDYYVRLLATDALEKFGILSPELKVRRYMLDLGDGNCEVRNKAADSLGALGPDAKEALPKLRKLLADEDEIVRIAAENAIGKIGTAQDSTNP
jgi:HEAT repeat protein